MIEDKLTRPERIRLEALAQANAWGTMKPGTSAETILDVAGKFEKWIFEGTK